MRTICTQWGQGIIDFTEEKECFTTKVILELILGEMRR
jgi:hypothetical protein